MCKLRDVEEQGKSILPLPSRFLAIRWSRFGIKAVRRGSKLKSRFIFQVKTVVRALAAVFIWDR
ncbi:hypothetical protein [Dialister invisus]|uniref:hypothetical protein n=1 Tax=Dialister invisus TaxID=218538 RepID=UPI0026DA9E22|nr:hypothetical protein [Dialister invisus]